MAWTVAIGVDTHKDAHVAVALDVLGVELDHCVVEATLAGYRRLLSWAALLGSRPLRSRAAGATARAWRVSWSRPSVWCGSASGLAAQIAGVARTTSSTQAWRLVACSRAAA